MPKVISWTPEDWKKNLKKRLDAARTYRESFETQWNENLSTINNAIGRPTDQFNFSFDNIVELESGEVDAGDSEIGMNYAFKYLRFLHSQLSANPPSVIARPASTDPADRRKADAADRLVRYAIRDQDMQEVIDNMTLYTLIFGTGYTKVVWDPDKGDVFDFNEETSEVLMEGDHLTYSVNTQDMWIDPDAKRRKDIKWAIERHIYNLDEAIFKFPEAADLLKKKSLSKQDYQRDIFDLRPPQAPEEKVEVFEYYETGCPINGMAGRHAWFLEDGTTLGKPGKNPHYKAKLPYKILTYIDVPNQVYGKSTVEYVARLQNMLNRLDSSVLDSIQAHGVVRMAIHETTEIEDESVTNSSWDWIKYSGSQPPTFMSPAAIMQDIWRFRDALLVAIQELYGINDSMLGIQRREQSAVSQQTSIEAGTMIHRRLFKKYAGVVEEVYLDWLGLARENWDEPRHILVLGKERAFEAADIRGADIAGGYDLVVEYGASLPIDPNMRREAIMLLMQPLKEAGMSMKQILKYMKLNDIESMYDRMEMSYERQREIFEEMIAKFREGTPVYIAPKELEEHQGRLEYAYDYLETEEYKNLELDLQELINQHIKEREQFNAQRAQPAQPPGEAAPAGMPGTGGAQSPSVGGQPDLATMLGG